MAPQDRRGFGEKIPAFERRDPATQHDVREVQASVAKTHFSQLLDEVERGATIVILRHGRPIARIIPDPERRRRNAAEVFANIKQLAKERTEQLGPMTIEEIISSIHEGHKY